MRALHMDRWSAAGMGTRRATVAMLTDQMLMFDQLAAAEAQGTRSIVHRHVPLMLQQIVGHLAADQALEHAIGKHAGVLTHIR